MAMTISARVAALEARRRDPEQIPVTKQERDARVRAYMASQHDLDAAETRLLSAIPSFETCKRASVAAAFRVERGRRLHGEMQ